MKVVKFILVFLGATISLFLLLDTSTCPLSGCPKLVVNGVNIPAIFGLIWFTLYPLMNDRILVLWQIAAIGGIVFLSLYALINSYYCPYCFFAYLTGILLIMLDRRTNKKEFK